MEIGFVSVNIFGTWIERIIQTITDVESNLKRNSNIQNIESYLWNSYFYTHNIQVISSAVFQGEEY